MHILNNATKTKLTESDIKNKPWKCQNTLIKYCLANYLKLAIALMCLNVFAFAIITQK